MLALNPNASVPAVVGGTSVQFATTLRGVQVGTSRYAFVSTTTCWVAQGANPTAAAGTAGSVLVPANTVAYLDGYWGAKVAVIQDSAAGKASLTAVSQ